MKNLTLIIVLLFGASGLLCSQEVVQLPDEILQLRELRKQTLELEDARERRDMNQRFKSQLQELIEDNSAALSYWDSIPHLGRIESPDKAFVLYNWNILLDRQDFDYHAIIQTKDMQVISLTDESKQMRDPKNQVNKTTNWYGALYYDIIPTKVKKQGTYYVLLGWDGKSEHGTRKVIDVFYYDKAMKNWYFGKKIFGPPYADQTRYFLEYSSEAVVSMKYHKKRSQIVFDHLVPASKGMEGITDYYVPDMSFDAFEFRKDRWYFVQNVDIRGSQTMENYVDPNPGERRR